MWTGTTPGLVRKGRSPASTLLAAVAGSLVAMGAIAGAVTGLTEAGGGTPAPARPAPPAVKNLDPETTTVYTDQQAFLDAVACRALSLESFEDRAATNRIDTSSLVLADLSITTDNPPQLGVWNERFQGAFATDGVQWLGVEENALVTPHVMTLTFDVMINHFGVNITDYGDFGSGNLEFASDSGDVATAALSGQPSGNRQFFGIINSARAFRSVTLTHTVGGEFYGIDEIYYCWRVSPDTPMTRRATGRVVPD